MMTRSEITDLLSKVIYRIAEDVKDWIHSDGLLMGHKEDEKCLMIGKYDKDKNETIIFLYKIDLDIWSPQLVYKGDIAGVRGLR